MGMPSKSSPAFFGLTPATKHALPLAYARLVCVWNMPVLPVMPCVITRVFSSMRMLMCFDPLTRGSGAGGEQGVSGCSCFFLSPFCLLRLLRLLRFLRFLRRLALCLRFLPRRLCFLHRWLRLRCGLFLLHGPHHLLRRVGHVVCRDDRQPGIAQDLLAEVLVGALHAYDEGNGKLHLACRGNHARGDGVALHDAAEDVDEDRLHPRVLQHDFEC